MLVFKNKIIKEGKEAEGIIIKPEDDSYYDSIMDFIITDDRYYVKYNSVDGKEFIGEIINYIPNLKIGKKVIIKYLPGQEKYVCFVKYEE